MTLLFAALIAIGVAAYLQLAQTSFALAQRTFVQSGTLDLAELGLEEAMSCYNQIDDAGAVAAWSSWVDAGGTAKRNTFSGYLLADGTFANFKPDAGSTGMVKVWVENSNPGPGVYPKVVAKAIVTPQTGPGFVRMLELTLHRRGIFSVGIVARGAVHLSSNTVIDSWDSDPDNNPTTASISYSAAVRQANAFVGTYSATNYALDPGGAQIYGRAGTGGGAVANGGGALTGTWGAANWDTSRITSNFTGDPALPSAPVPAVLNYLSSGVHLDTTLPRPGDLPNPADGKYYYTLAGETVSLSGSNVLTIAANSSVVLIATAHAMTTAISTSGNGAISISGGGKLEIYTNGDIAIAGNGIMNQNTAPASCLIYGTNPTNGGQSIALNGNGATVGAIYAPNATLTVGGNGDFYGSTIVSSITSMGNAHFHFDESLARFAISTPTGNPWGILQWVELTSPDQRQTYSGRFNF